jgi:hypothetical protein
MHSGDFHYFQKVLNDFLLISHLHRFGNGARGFRRGLRESSFGVASPSSFPDPVRPPAIHNRSPLASRTHPKTMSKSRKHNKNHENHSNLHFFVEILIFQGGRAV